MNMGSITESVCASQAVFALGRNAEVPNGKLFNTIAPALVTSKTTDERISEFNLITDCVNLLLAEVGCPEKVRPLVDAIVGIAGERRDEWFPANDTVVAKRLGMSKKTVQRYRDDLTAWQDENRVTFVQIEAAYTDSDGKHHPHRYRAHISRMAVEVLDEARADTVEFRKNRGAALQQAAKRKRDELPDMPARTHRGRKFEPDAETVITKSLKTIATHALKVQKTIGGIDLHQRMYGNNEPYRWNPEQLNIIRQIFDTQSDWTPGNDSGGDGESVHQPYKKLVDKRDTEGAIEAGCVPSEEGGGQIVHMDDARRAIEVFESVGADEFAVTMLAEKTKAAEYDSCLDSRTLVENLESLLERNAATTTSFIVRPRGTSLIQLDDVTASALERVEQFAFLVAETSTGNYQAWLALSMGTSGGFLRTRTRLLAAMGETGTNGGAYGAMRWPGSINRKPSRDGFRVRIVAAQPGRTVTAAELETAGLLAPEPILTKATTPVFLRSTQRKMPDYQRCLASKYDHERTKYDRSKADASFMKLCFLGGFTKDEAIRELERVSERAQEERRRGRDRYFELTSKYAGY